MRIKGVGNIFATFGLISIGILVINLAGILLVRGGWHIFEAIGVAIVGVISIGIIGHTIALGNPINGMPPESTVLKVEYAKIKVGDNILLLLSEKEKDPEYYKINKDRFNNFQEIKEGITIRNVYGTIEIVPPPS